MSLTLTSATFDKPVYSLGDTVLLTIAYASTDSQGAPGTTVPSAVQLALSDDTGVVAPDTAGPPATVYNVAMPGTLEAMPVTVSATDATDGRTWSVISNTMTSFDPATGASTWTAALSMTLPSA